MSTGKTQHQYDTSDDVSLVHAAKGGDMEAFEELVRRHTTLIFRVAMHSVSSREEAEEVVQDTFLKAFVHLQQFEERARFSTWVTRIAVNTALMRLRGLRRANTISLDEETDEGFSLAEKVADWRPNPDQLYSQAELRFILQQALALLSPSYRVVFLLRDVEGISAGETAEMLGQSISSVKARLFRARLQLRKHLSHYFARGNATAASVIAPKTHVELRSQAGFLESELPRMSEEISSASVAVRR
jgi:RNA polymerase sigma-70 factor (ECF subfamily)